MATGSEPISAENLGSVLAGAGLARTEVLFSGSGSSATLPRPVSDYDMLLVIITDDQFQLLVTVLPSVSTKGVVAARGGTFVTVTASGSKVSATGGNLKRVIGMTF